MVFILLGNIARSLKFELISHKIGLVFFFTMELDTHELFHCQAYDCNYCDDKLCDVSKADCIARVYILLSKLCFLKLYMYIQIKPSCPQSCLTKSERRNIKLRCYSESRNSNSGTSNVSNKKHPDYRHRSPEIQL